MPETKPSQTSAPAILRSFADFKRRLAVGVVLHCEHHKRPAISGPRRIVKVQSNAIAYEWESPDPAGTVTKTGWCHWGPATERTVHNNSVTFIDDQSREPIFTYYLPDGSDLIAAEKTIEAVAWIAGQTPEQLAAELARHAARHQTEKPAA